MNSGDGAQKCVVIIIQSLTTESNISEINVIIANDYHHCLSQSLFTCTNPPKNLRIHVNQRVYRLQIILVRGLLLCLFKIRKKRIVVKSKYHLLIDRKMLITSSHSINRPLLSVLIKT
uniref:Uncharacterized protein n=1 Tax=Onchocerca volvulus TaxID=6282 RepID=A0A8R1TU03_ONCVO